MLYVGTKLGKRQRAEAKLAAEAGGATPHTKANGSKKQPFKAGVSGKGTAPKARKQQKNGNALQETALPSEALDSANKAKSSFWSTPPQKKQGKVKRLEQGRISTAKLSKSKSVSVGGNANRAERRRVKQARLKADITTQKAE